MERIGDDFYGPTQTGLHIANEKKLHRAEEKSADSDCEPEDGCVVQVAHCILRRRQEPEDGGGEIEQDW